MGLSGQGEAGMWMSGGHTKLINQNPWEIIESVTGKKEKESKTETKETHPSLSLSVHFPILFSIQVSTFAFVLLKTVLDSVLWEHSATRRDETTITHQVKRKKKGKKKQHPETKSTSRYKSLCFRRFSLKYCLVKMPRPGPRPYECVRKPWHSDRHQPIRGSLIQEIFRVVNEVHSSATKKNKEWQEKLPVVVLKAEEIMYSKANSEAEYMDLKTLWDRTNDAINTIIRPDESTETGDLLQPCIEAALNLGCTPRRTSRSQRNCNPRCYLTPGAQEPGNLPPGMLNNMTSPNCIRNYSNLVKPSIMNLNPFGSESRNLVFKNAGVTYKKFPTAADNGCLFNCKQSFPVENHPLSNLCAVYPLYYGSCVEPQFGLGVIPESLSNASEPCKFSFEKNLLSVNEHAALKFYEPDSHGGRLNQNEIGCDLSLRLGSLSVPLPVAETRELQCVHGNGHGSSHVMIQLKHQATQADNAIDSRSSKLSEDLMVKKRKAIFCQPMDDQAYYKPKLSCNDSIAKMKSRGL